jgi:ABC-2 type transport system permease protein
MPLRLMVALPVAVAAAWWVGPERITHDPLLLALFPLTVLGAWLITFLSMAMVGTLAFRFDSATSVFELWLGLFGIFSGYLVPLELFPPWVAGVARWLPFRSMLGYPVELVTGLLTRPQALLELAIQWGWIAGLGVLVHFAWRAGLRRFAAFGG